MNPTGLSPSRGPESARELTARELATLLAALRFWQDEMGPHPHAGCYPEHFDGIVPLDSREIDDLCERLNTMKEPA